MRRWILLIVVSLVLGAIVTVGVAWIFTSQSKQYFGFLLQTPVVLTGNNWMWPTGESWPEKPLQLHTGRPSAGIRVDTQTASLQERATYFDYSLTRYSYGWPMPSLCNYTAITTEIWPTGSVRQPNIQKPNTNASLNFESFAYGYDYPTRQLFRARLPLVPRPIGFAVNTLFYGVFVWLTLFGIARAKQKRRRVKGCCLRCGYDLTNLNTCPECGTPAAKKAGA